jgi:outer membrane receptor protein involved in Fe transport
MAIICLTSIALATGADKLQIVGKIVDGKTGEPIVGAAIQLADTSIGALTDIDGNYVIRKTPEGVYDLIVRCVGYSKLRVEGVIPREGDDARYDLVLQQETIKTGIIVTVKAEAVKNTEAALLKERQFSIAVSDAISTEAISRSGSGDAAAALKKVTGATVVGGKYVYVRGMGDRYTNTRLNNSTLPSPAADKQIAPMDIFPSELLDNVVIEKTFTPDKPANFAGGSVNLSTREMSGDQILLKFSSSMGYNTQATFNSDFLTYSGGTRDWIGVDDGTRGMPKIFENPDIDIPNPVGKAKRDRDEALLLDEMARSFNSNMYPVDGYAPMNQKYSLAYGNVLPVFGMDASVLASLSYSRSFKFYDNGVVARWDLASQDVMDVHQYLADQKSTDEVLWGTMINTKFPLGNKHKVGVNYIYTRNAESQARYLEGPFQEAFSPPTDFQTRVLKYTSRDVGSLQFTGDHKFSTGRAVNLDWKFSITNTSEDEPDFRTFSNSRRSVGDGDTVWTIQSNQNPFPNRIYRELDEKNREVAANFSVPFNQWSGLPSKFKLGSGFLRKTRENSEREFKFQFGPIEPEFESAEDVFNPDYFGLLNSSGTYYWFGNWYDETTRPGQSYEGEQEIFSLYSMVELPLLEKFTLVAGARYEKTLMHVESVDTSGTIHDSDVLPSVNFICRLHDNMNLRLSYGRTLARPTFREFAKLSTYEYATGYIVSGNPQLKGSLIDNYDFRWEFFERPGELWAFSLFYKTIKDPIELGKVSVNNNIKFVNVEDGKVYGAEFEIRKKLDQIHDLLTYFQVGSNLTLVKSEVQIPEIELNTIRNTRPDADNHRPLEGQSPYTLNVDVAYVNPHNSTSVALNYNVFGERLVEKGRRATPDAFEQPRHQLDLTFSKGIWYGLTLKSGVKNILDSTYRVTHAYQGEKYTRREHKLGREIAFGVSYEI